MAGSDVLGLQTQADLHANPHANPPAGPQSPNLPAPSKRRRQATVKAPKAQSAAACHRLEDLPNIGPAMAADLRAMGIGHPRELAHRDAFVLYQTLCALSGKRQDPCVLDTFMAATDFMRGAAPAPWWSYTAQRKLLYGSV
jgi:Pathogenicity locus